MFFRVFCIFVSLLFSTHCLNRSYSQEGEIKADVLDQTTHEKVALEVDKVNDVQGLSFFYYPTEKPKMRVFLGETQPDFYLLTEVNFQNLLNSSKKLKTSHLLGKSSVRLDIYFKTDAIKSYPVLYIVKSNPDILAQPAIPAKKLKTWSNINDSTTSFFNFMRQRITNHVCRVVDNTSSTKCLEQLHDSKPGQSHLPLLKELITLNYENYAYFTEQGSDFTQSEAAINKYDATAETSPNNIRITHIGGPTPVFGPSPGFWVVQDSVQLMLKIAEIFELKINPEFVHAMELKKLTLPKNEFVN